MYYRYFIQQKDHFGFLLEKFRVRFKIMILKFYYSLESLLCLALLSRQGLQEKNVVEQFLIENEEFLSKIKT